jgi:hypothetical protein
MARVEVLAAGCNSSSCGRCSLGLDQLFWSGRVADRVCTT